MDFRAAELRRRPPSRQECRWRWHHHARWRTCAATYALPQRPRHNFSSEDIGNCNVLNTQCNVTEHLYSSPLGIYSEAISALTYMLLNVIDNEYATLINKTRYSKLKESTVALGRLRDEAERGCDGQRRGEERRYQEARTSEGLRTKWVSNKIQFYCQAYTHINSPFYQF